MEQFRQEDLVRLKELLSHTGEFVAYFELAEAKMNEWREEMEQQAVRWQQHTQTLEHQLTSVNKLLSQVGIADFREAVSHALLKGEANVQVLDKHCNQYMLTIQQQEEKIELLTEKCIASIEQHASASIQTMAKQLSKYDARQFHRIANESCDHVERVAHNALSKSNKLLGVLQLRFGIFVVFITMLTAFVIGLYLNDELPWEMHHKARNERHAGKVLLQAWPNLSQEEKAKILSDEG